MEEERESHGAGWANTFDGHVGPVPNFCCCNIHDFGSFIQYVPPFDGSAQRWSDVDSQMRWPALPIPSHLIPSRHLNAGKVRIAHIAGLARHPRCEREDEPKRELEVAAYPDQADPC